MVRFDRPVRADGGGVLPVDVGAGREPFPAIVWQALGADSAAFAFGKVLPSSGTTLRLGVRLQPGRTYELLLGNPQGQGFRGERDGMPVAPYRIDFQTRP